MSSIVPYGARPHLYCQNGAANAFWDVNGTPHSPLPRKHPLDGGVPGVGGVGVGDGVGVGGIGVGEGVGGIGVGDGDPPGITVTKSGPESTSLIWFFKLQ